MSSMKLRSSYKSSAILKNLSTGIVISSSMDRVDELNSVLRRERRLALEVTILLLDFALVKRVGPIRELVNHLTALECLRLSFPADVVHTYRLSRSILPSATFSRLTTFDSNLPHAALAGFLAHQPQLQSLTLGSCGSSRACPLGGCSNLASLTSVKCEELRCVLRLRSSAASISSIHVEVLRVEASEPLPNVRAVRFSASGSDTLAIHRLTRLCPDVELLAITEQTPALSETDSQPGLALSMSLAAWAQDLLRLPLLYKFQLQLTHGFGSCLGDDAAEVRRWLARCARHPILRRVCLWTESSYDGDGGRLRCWERRDGRWEPTLDQQGGYIEEHHVLV